MRRTRISSPILAVQRPCRIKMILPTISSSRDSRSSSKDRSARLYHFTTAHRENPTTTTTTTTTVAVDRTAPTVTLARNAGSSSSSTILFTVTGNEAINCATLSFTNNVDFTFTRISFINSITQTSTSVCTISASSTAERGDTVARASILTAAATFSVSDTAGNAQTTLLGSPQQTWVLRT